MTLAWKTFACELVREKGAAATIGLIALGGDSVIESELRALLPWPDVKLFVTRVAFSPELSEASAASLKADACAAARLIVPGTPLDVVAFGCTSGAVAIGPAAIRAAILGARPGVQVTDPITAAIEAMFALGLRRVGLVTPYSDSVNRRLVQHLAAHGLTVAAAGTFRAAATSRLGRTPPTLIPPEAIQRAVVEIGKSEVDGIFISCTGLRCVSMLEELEAQTGKPIVSSNQAMSWHSLALAKCARPAAAGSRLLQLRPALPA
jgi:maleate isomerase